MNTYRVTGTRQKRLGPQSWLTQQIPTFTIEAASKREALRKAEEIVDDTDGTDTMLDVQEV